MVERFRCQSVGRVLIVEDNEDTRELVRLLIEGEGYSVECAENGQEALERIRAARPSFILLDLMMPVMSGWQLLDVLAQDAQLAAIPVAIISAAHDVDVSDELRRGRMVLPKPLRPEALLAALPALAARAGGSYAVAV